MISALQHYIFCQRQCALIHIEQIWDENRATAEGRIMHERVHEQDRESRGMSVLNTAPSAFFETRPGRQGGCGGIPSS